jgi:hypothetical protein
MVWVTYSSLIALLWFCLLRWAAIQCITKSMSSTDTNILKFMCGKPAIYSDVCMVSSPFLKDIAAEGLNKFYQYISII